MRSVYTTWFTGLLLFSCVERVSAIDKGYVIASVVFAVVAACISLVKIINACCSVADGAAEQPTAFYITTEPQAPQGVAYYDDPPPYNSPAHNYPDAPHQPIQPIAQNIAIYNLQEPCITAQPNNDHQD